MTSRIHVGLVQIGLGLVMAFAYNFTVSAQSPPPDDCQSTGTLQITPSKTVLGLEQVRSLGLVDANGTTPTDITWEVANPAIAEVVQDDAGMFVRGLGPGDTCIAGTSGTDQAKAKIRVLSTPTVPSGMQTWSIAKAATGPIESMDMVAAQADNGQDAALFMVETERIDYTDALQRATVRGVHHDGQELWRHRLDHFNYYTSFGDTQGGMVLLLGTPLLNTLVRLEGVEGTETWRYNSPGTIMWSYTVRQDNTMFVFEATQTETEALGNYDLIGINLSTGQVVSRLPLPKSVALGTGEPYYYGSHLSNLITAEDGSVDFVVGSATDDAACGGGCTVNHAEMTLMRLAPDNSLSSQALFEYDNTAAIWAPKVYCRSPS